MNHVLKKDTKIIIVMICLLLGFVSLTFAQSIQVRGKVIDESGEGIIGASVMQKGATNVGTATDVNGDFTLNVPGNATLVISYLGYVSQEVRVNNQTNLSIRLSEDLQALDEVVVTGYTTQRRLDLTGSVAAVTNKDIVVTKNENVVNMLTGKLPGVRISQRSSRPGSYDAVIDIRGFNTNDNSRRSSPLFVIDGVTRDYDYFARMDPEEIESVSVLKDGSAAIYGVRAANGVFLVTTKKGTPQQGKVDITYTGNFTAQTFLYMPDGISPVDLFTLREEWLWQQFNNNYLVKRPTNADPVERQQYIDGKPGYNWIDLLLNDVTPQHQHNLSINGGNERLAYFFSLGYLNQQSAFSSGDYWSDRYNFRSNVDAQITNRLKARVSTGAVLTTNYEVRGSGWTDFKQIWLASPLTPFYANDNPLYFNGDNSRLFENNNMLAQTDADVMGYNLQKQRRLNGALSLTYDIPGVKGLSASAMYDYSLSLPDTKTYRKTYSLYNYNPVTDVYTPSVRSSPAGVTRSTTINYGTNMQLRLNYINRFGNHDVNALLLFEETYVENDNFSAYRDLLLSSDQLFAGERNGNTNASATGNQVYDRLSQAIVGQFAYNYSGKYLADFRFRYDGSSKFPADSRWGFFPSISLGWRLSEEGFLKNNFEFLSNLKLRASYGELGDDNATDNYPSTFVGYNIDGGNVAWYYNSVLTNGVSTTGIPNPNLTWYKAKMYNIAMDFGVLSNKLTGTLDIFKRDRSGLLARRGSLIPGTTGAELPLENLDSDRIWGYELELQHHNRVGGINYFVNGQISATKMMRTHYTETPANNSYDKWRNKTSGRYTNIWWSWESGGMFKSIDEIRSYTTVPMPQGALPGDWYGIDWNGDGVIDNTDQHPVALQALPLFNYGITTGASWKSFDIALNFQGAYGSQVRYSEVLIEPNPWGEQFTNILYWWTDRWHPEDPNADFFHPDTKWVEGYYPITGHDSRRVGTNLIENASYLRLKTLEFGYTIPKTLVSKAGIKDLRIYVSGYNLLTFTPIKNVDPERPGSAGGNSTAYEQFYNYPINRTYTVGASIKF